MTALSGRASALTIGPGKPAQGYIIRGLAVSLFILRLAALGKKLETGKSRLRFLLG